MYKIQLAPKTSTMGKILRLDEKRSQLLQQAVDKKRKEAERNEVKEIEESIRKCQESIQAIKQLMLELQTNKEEN